MQYNYDIYGVMTTVFAGLFQVIIPPNRIRLCLFLIGYGSKRVEQNGENTQCKIVVP